MGSPFFRFGMYYRTILETRGLTVPDVQRLCVSKVKPARHYRFLRGERLPDVKELKHMEKRLNFNTPEDVLNAEDRFGRPVKDFQLNLSLRKK